MTVSGQFSWFLFNIAIPLLAPLALLPLIKLPYFFRKYSRGIVMRAIEHGQMLWAVIPMSASACNLLAQHMGGNSANQDLMWMVMCGHIVIIVLAAGMVLLGAMESCLTTQPGTSGRPNLILRASLLLTCISAGGHFAGYSYLIQPTMS
nr:hypothetical protein [uncultured Cupriavidus sp.]